MKLQPPQGGLTPPFVFALTLLDTVLVVGLVVLFIRATASRVASVLLAPAGPAAKPLCGVALVPACSYS